MCFSQRSRAAARDSSSATLGGASGSGGGATGSTTAPTTRTRSAAAKVGVPHRMEQPSVLIIVRVVLASFPI